MEVRSEPAERGAPAFTSQLDAQTLSQFEEGIDDQTMFTTSAVQHSNTLKIEIVIMEIIELRVTVTPV